MTNSDLIYMYAGFTHGYITVQSLAIIDMIAIIDMNTLNI